MHHWAGEVIPSPKAVAPLNGAFLIDEAELKAKQEEVANQSKSPARRGGSNFCALAGEWATGQ